MRVVGDTTPRLVKAEEKQQAKPAPKRKPKAKAE